MCQKSFEISTMTWWKRCGPWPSTQGSPSELHRGYRVHTTMIRLSWQKTSVKDRIKALPSHKQRKKARRARRFLLSSPASAYKHFYDEHRRALRVVDDEASDEQKDLKLPLRYMETVGIECALWPHLYWSVQMCETKVREGSQGGPGRMASAVPDLDSDP